jgi:type IVB pilus formation R64 PilN family outer membrane protein
MSLSIISIAITSCAFPAVQATKDALHKDMKTGGDISNKMDENRTRDDLISFSGSPFLGSSKYIISKQAIPLPGIFNKSFSISTNEKRSLRRYVRNLNYIHGLKVKISHDAINQLVVDADNSSSSSTSPTTTILKQDTIKYAMNFDGTLKGYLDNLTNNFELSWKYVPAIQTVVIFYTQTKSFKLVVPNSEITDTSTISNTDIGNESSVGYSNKSSNAFADAVDSIKSMAKDPKNISVATDKAFSIVTVTATPAIMEKVSKYIALFNKESEKGVQVKISVYEVKTDKDSNYGLDWNLMYNGTNTLVNWTTAGLTNAVSSSLTTATIKAGIASGMWAGSNIVASALQSDLGASYLTGYNFYSLNGQTTPLSNGKRDGYVSKLETVVVGGGLTNSSKSSVEQATIQTGFTGNVLSNVVGDNKIFLRLSMNMSKLIKFEKVDYGTQDQPSIIQIPHTEDSKIIQNIILKSGQTAVITGFTTDDNQVGTSSICDKKWWWLGGNQGTKATKETIVIIVSAYSIGDSQ